MYVNLMQFFHGNLIVRFACVSRKAPAVPFRSVLAYLICKNLLLKGYKYRDYLSVQEML